MKNEYSNKLEILKRFKCWDNLLSEEENRKNSRKYFEAVDFLVKTKDVNVLFELLDFFNEENKNIGGILEDLKSQIGDNFSLKQILEAFYGKFDSLIKNDIETAVEMSMWFWESDEFDEFRKMFNTVKSEKSEDFLDEFVSWFPNLEEGVNILRDDMQKW